MGEAQNYIGTPCGRVICIDGIEGQQAAGRFYHFYSQEGRVFGSLDELVFGMEAFFDEINFPTRRRRGGHSGERFRNSVIGRR